MKKFIFMCLLLCVAATCYSEDGRMVAVRLHVSVDADAPKPENIKYHFYCAPDTLGLPSYGGSFNPTTQIVDASPFEAGKEYFVQVYAAPKSKERFSAGNITEEELIAQKLMPSTWVRFAIPADYTSEVTTDIYISPEDYDLPEDENGNIVFRSMEELKKYQDASRHIVPVFDLGDIRL